MDEIYAPDFVHRNAPPEMPNDREGHKALVGMYLGAFPDLKTTIDILVAEGDLVVSRATGTGMHTGELMGTPATGKRMTVTTITIARIAGGKIAEIWSEVDTMATI